MKKNNCFFFFCKGLHVGQIPSGMLTKKAYFSHHVRIVQKEVFRPKEVEMISTFCRPGKYRFAGLPGAADRLLNSPVHGNFTVTLYIIRLVVVKEGLCS